MDRSVKRSKVVSNGSRALSKEYVADYNRVCIVNPNASDRMERLLVIARYLNIVATPYMDPNVICQRIGQYLAENPLSEEEVEGMFAALPGDMVREIQLYMSTQDAQKLRSTARAFRDIAPSTQQWINKYRRELGSVGLLPEMYPATSAERYDLLQRFDDASGRRSFEFMLEAYPAFFLEPGQTSGLAGQSVAATGQYVYAPVPGAPLTLYTKPNRALYNSFQNMVRSSITNMNEDAVDATVLAIKFPEDNDPRGLPFVIIIRFTVNDEGVIVGRSEYPAGCTPGRAEVRKAMLESNIRDAQTQAYFLQYPPGVYEEWVKVAAPDAWQNGYYPPPPTGPQGMIQVGMRVDSADTGSVFVRHMKRFMDAGFSVTIPQGLVHPMPGIMSCLSKASIARTYLNVIMDNKLYQWSALPASTRHAIARRYPNPYSNLVHLLNHDVNSGGVATNDMFETFVGRLLPAQLKDLANPVYGPVNTEQLSVPGFIEEITNLVLQPDA